MTPTLLAFVSSHNDIIPFSRVVGVSSHGIMDSTDVYLEEKQSINLMGEDVEEFQSQYTMYLSIVQALELGVELEETNNGRTRKG